MFVYLLYPDTGQFTLGFSMSGYAPDSNFMSVVTIQFGQCGNQLGQAFFDTMMDEIYASGTTHQDVFFRTGLRDTQPTSRALLVDMEPKVVAQCIESAQASGKWKYDKKNTCTRQSGSGNNWAYGYNVHGRVVCDEVLELVRKVSDSSNYYSAVQRDIASGSRIV